MWITFSLFLQYSYVLASVQYENCSHNDMSFPAIPNMPGSIGQKWFGLRPPNNLGSGHATISDTWILICFTIYSYRRKKSIKTTNFSVFCIFQYLSSLKTKHNRHHNRYNHGRHQQKWPPSTPHKALRSAPMHQMDGWQPSKLRMYLGGGWGCVWPSKRSFVLVMMHHNNIGVFLGPYTPSTAPKIISACLGGCWPSIQCIGLERKASSGALGGNFHWQRPWSAMVVFVDVCRWRLTSDWPTVGIVTIVYRSNFFYFYIDPIHSWHLTRQLKKEDLDLRTLVFR